MGRRRHRRFASEGDGLESFRDGRVGADFNIAQDDDDDVVVHEGVDAGDVAGIAAILLEELSSFELANTPSVGIFERAHVEETLALDALIEEIEIVDGRSRGNRSR